MSKTIEKTLNGYANPRYLNYDWNRSFSITSQPTHTVDIPVRVIFEKLAYDNGKFNNEQLTYQELREENSRLKAFICAEDLNEKYRNWN